MTENENKDFMLECSTGLKENKFRFQNQKVMLTYSTHIDKNGFGQFLTDKGWCPKKLYIAHELGTNDPITPYPHSHCVIDFGKIKQTTDVRFFDFCEIHPHISIIKDKLAWKKACKYICKEDQSVGPLLHNDDCFNEISSVWSHNTIAEALEKCTLKDAMATIAVYQHKPMELPEPRIQERQFYSWQHDLNEELKEYPDGRSIIWIFEEVGCTGKSRFAEWMCLTQPNKAVMLNNVGKITDFAQNIKNFWDQGWRGDTVFLNLARSYSDRTSLYEACEIISDGYITCTKYTGGTIWLPPIHVVVLSNFFPLTDNLSADRWKIYRLDKIYNDDGNDLFDIEMNRVYARPKLPRYNPMGI